MRKVQLKKWQKKIAIRKIKSKMFNEIKSFINNYTHWMDSRR